MSKSERRKRMIQLAGGEKKFKELIKLRIIGGRKKAKKKKQQTLSKQASVDKLYPKQSKQQSEYFLDGFKKKKHKPSAAHGKGPRKGQIPGREPKKEKK